MLAATAAFAQPYPVEPIRLILPQGPGGDSDLVARLMSPEIEKRLGQPFVIENKPGGNDSIAPDAVSKATPGTFNYGSAGPKTFGGMAKEKCEDPKGVAERSCKDGARSTHDTAMKTVKGKA